MSVIDELLNAEPTVNVIGKDHFDERVHEIFDIIGECLSRSLGPFGAPAIISQYPYHHITKDGFTIMKNIHFDKTSGYMDQVIADMAADICGRLNFSVGDGTTSAIVSTNCIYNSYIENKKLIEDSRLLPRDILEMYQEIKEDALMRLDSKAISIQDMSKEDMLNHIHDVVYVSSNGNDEITDMIVELYEHIEYPAITVSVAADGITKSNIVDGFLHDSMLTDRLYINNDNETLHATNCDVLIFDHKVNIDEYAHILRPVSRVSEQCGRKLICLAPMYDEVMMQTTVIPDLNRIYKTKKDLPLILMGYKNTSEHTKKRISDLAMLCGTALIGIDYARKIIKKVIDNGEKISSGHPFSEEMPFNMNLRNIPGIQIWKKNEQGNLIIDTATGNETEDETYWKLPEDFIDVGFVGEVELGLKTSIYKNFFYDEKIYQCTIEDAEKDLYDAVEKYKRLGTFNVAVTQCQNRLNSLKLKMGSIEVGADSEFSQTYLKDAVDDAVKAAESAYNNGIVLGCHVTLLQVLYEMKDGENFGSVSDGPETYKFPLSNSRRSSKMYKFLLDILINGFKSVFKTVLMNMREEHIAVFDSKPTAMELLDEICRMTGFDDMFVSVIGPTYGVISKVIRGTKPKYSGLFGLRTRYEYDIYDIIIDIAIESGKVFDLSKETYNKDVINSTATDKEILKATIDLISLLMTGNQLVISRPN